MDSWRGLGLLSILLVAVGCRAGRLTEPLERENRHLEDVIYELEDHLHELQAKLDSSHRENASLRRQLGDGRRDDYDDDGIAPRQRELSPPRTELGDPTHELPLPRRSPESLEAAPPFPGPPLISPPSPDQPDGFLPDGAFDAFDGYIEEGYIEEEELVEPDGVAPASALRVEDKRAASAALPDDVRVAKMTLNRQLTGGHNRDEHPGDDGVMVVVELRAQDDTIVNVPGDLSIVVLDTARQGAGRRVARWDFEADEMAKLYKKTLLAEGFHFALPWPGPPPVNTELMLLVRYQTPSGEELIVDRPIRVKLSPYAHDRDTALSATPAVRDVAAASTVSEEVAAVTEASALQAAAREEPAVQQAASWQASTRSGQTAQRISAQEAATQPAARKPDRWSSAR